MKPPFLSSRSFCLESLFSAHRGNTALVSQSGPQTFEEIRQRLRGVVWRLEQAGVRRGDRVALHAENRELHLLLLLAAWVIGFLHQPLDFKAPLAGLDRGAAGGFLVTGGAAPPPPGVRHLDPAELLQAPPPGAGQAPWPRIPLGREASVIYTSGSTGSPRGLVHTVGNYLYSAAGTNKFIALTPADRWLVSLPLSHVGGILIWVRTLIAGGASILPESLKGVEQAIRADRPTVLSLVPTQLIRFLESSETLRALQETRLILLGGAPSPAWLIERALDCGLAIMPTYGATESCAQLTGVEPGAKRAAFFTAGKALPYRELAIAPDGTIRIGGKTLFRRYAEEPAGRRSGRRFHATADAGYIDPDGNLVVLGRRDGMFISGGENIHPFEIENHLLALPGVETAIVTPVAHREFGMVPWAFVETAGPLDEAALLGGLRQRLPAYKLPKRILRLDPQGRGGRLKYSRPEIASLAAGIAGGEET